MKKRLTNILPLVLMALLLFPGFNLLSAQDLTTSPYSRFGIGDMINRSTGRGQAMGGLSCGLRSEYNLNLLNPASLSSIDSTDFLFEMSGFVKATDFATTDLNKTVNNMGFSYLAMGFPINKWLKASVGVLPVSNIGYSMTTTEQSPVMGTVKYKFDGSGGVSQVFASASVSPMKYLSLGATFAYVFGPLSHSKSLVIPADSLYFSTESVQTAIIGDINFNYGAQLDIPLKNDYFLTLGGIFQGQSNLKTESRSTLIVTGTSLTDTLSYVENPDNSIILPMGWGAGFTIGKKDKFTAGFDYRLQNWSESEFLGTKDSMANSHDYIFGVEYTPNANSLTRYLPRVHYRAGIRYSESYLQIKGYQIQEIGLTLGAGFPIRDRVAMRNAQSSMNVILEIGKRGTTNNNLIRETYGLLTLQFTLHDKWFIQRKFD